MQEFKNFWAGRDPSNSLVVMAVDDMRKSGINPKTLETEQVSLFSGGDKLLCELLGRKNIDKQPILKSHEMIEFKHFSYKGEFQFSRFKMIPPGEKKYLHPLGKPATPYIPKSVWAVSQKSNKPIWITEGEKKALKLVQHGEPAISIAGVWNFKAKNEDLFFELQLFNWHGRTVFIGFDSDMWTNSDVRMALYELSIRLWSNGAVVHIPQWEGGKGIDDFLAIQKTPEVALDSLKKQAVPLMEFIKPQHSQEIIRALEKSALSPTKQDQIETQVAKCLKISKGSIKKELARKGSPGMEEFSKQYYLIHGTTEVWDVKRKNSMRLDALRSLEPMMAKMWLNSPDKKIVFIEDIVFSPCGAKPGQINLFESLKIQPGTKPIPLILDHLNNLCGNDPDLIRWVTCWLAFPLQKIGAKMKTSIVVHGAQGTGKNLFFEDLVGKIYGQYSVRVDQSTLDEIYTDWLSGKLFIVADEVIANASQGRLKNFLKGVVTSETISIRSMYKSRRMEENHANIIFLSNNTMPLLIDNDDRRYCVIMADRNFDEDYFNALAGEISSGGVEGFYSYLLEYDLGDFFEHSKPPMTEAKRDLSILCEHPAVRFCTLWQEGALPVPYATCAAEELFYAFKLWCESRNEFGKISYDRFSKEFGRMVANGKLRNITTKSTRTGDKVRRSHEVLNSFTDFSEALENFKKRVMSEKHG